MDPDLRDLLTAWLGGEIEPARGADLLERVRHDDAFRRALVDEIRMLGMLKAVQSSDSRWLLLEDELGWSVDGSADREPDLEERIVSWLPNPPLQPRPFLLRVVAMVAAAVVLLTAGLIIAGSADRRLDRVREPYARLSPRPWPTGSRRLSQSYPRIDTVSGLALVVNLDGVQWEPDGKPHPSEGDVLATDRLKFRSGRLTLSMLTGVMVVVEGPADLELIGPERIQCNRGRLRAQVPHGAEGFVVSGPGSAVVDLGTEFGLNTAADGKSSGRVYKGAVEAALLSAEGTLQRSQLLKERNDFQIDPQAMRIDSVHRRDDFVTAVNLVAPPLVLDPSYPASVLDARPWGYWQFESLIDDITPNEIEGRPPLRATGLIHLEGPRRQPVRRDPRRHRTPVPDDGWVLAPDLASRLRSGTLVSLRFHQPCHARRDAGTREYR